MTTTAAADRDPLVGRVVDGRYEVLSVLGSGGSGRVYRGVHQRTGRPVAIKLPFFAPVGNAEATARFAREARATGAVGNPHVVEVLDAGMLDDGRPYLVMELLDGENLSELLAREQFLSPRRVADLIGQAAAALDSIHREGLIHRDVKPENLVLTSGGVLKLLDFGLVAFADAQRRLTRDGIVNGTPEYLPPEVFDQDEPSPRGDVYALGVVAFELATGALPIEADSPLRVLVRKRERVAPRLADRADLVFEEAFERAIARALERDPARRYATASAFADALRRAVDGVATDSITTDSVATDSVESSRGGARRGVDGDGERGALEDRERPTVSTDARSRRQRRRGRRALIALAAVVLGLALFGVLPDRAAEPSRTARADVASASSVAGLSALPSETVEPPPPETERLVSAEPGPTQAERIEPPPAPPSGRAPPSGAVAPRPPRETPSSGKPEIDAAAARRASGDVALRGPSERRPDPAAPDLEPPPEEDADERARALTATGMRQLVRGQAADAVESLGAATIASPHHAPAWRGLGLAHEHSNHPDEAARAYRRYLVLAPDGPQAGEVARRVERLER